MIYERIKALIVVPEGRGAGYLKRLKRLAYSESFDYNVEDTYQCSRGDGIVFADTEEFDESDNSDNPD